MGYFMDTMEHKPAYRDRRTGLILFGIIEIIIGLFCLLFAFFMVVGVMMGTAGGADVKLMIPSLLMYPVLAVAFIWLGIGSMTRRRWARALSLVLAWSWLAMGVVAIGVLVVIC